MHTAAPWASSRFRAPDDSHSVLILVRVHVLERRQEAIAEVLRQRQEGTVVRRDEAAAQGSNASTWAESKPPKNANIRFEQIHAHIQIEMDMFDEIQSTARANSVLFPRTANVDSESIMVSATPLYFACTRCEFPSSLRESAQLFERGFSSS